MSAKPELCAKAAEAEIERLRRTVNDLKSGWQSTYDHDTNWLKSEIERLRGELRKQPAESLVVLDLKEQLMSKDAEIERLRGEHQEYVATAMALQNAVAEIAHLRQLLAQATLWHRQFPISEVTHAE